MFRTHGRVAPDWDLSDAQGTNLATAVQPHQNLITFTLVICNYILVTTQFPVMQVWLMGGYCVVTVTKICS